MQTTTSSWSSSLSYSHLPEKSHAILDQTFKMRFLMLESAEEKSISGRDESLWRIYASRRFTFYAVSMPAYWPRTNKIYCILFLRCWKREKRSEKETVNEQWWLIWRRALCGVMHGNSSHFGRYAQAMSSKTRMYQSPFGEERNKSARISKSTEQIKNYSCNSVGSVIVCGANELMVWLYYMQRKRFISGFVDVSFNMHAAGIM